MTAVAPTAGERTSGFAVLGPGVRRWVLWLAIPALLIGVALYPDIHDRVMGTASGAVVVLALLSLVTLRGSARLLGLVPLGAGYLPATTAGFVAGAATLFLLLMLMGARRAAAPLEDADGPLLAILAWAILAWVVNLGQQTDAWSLPVSLLMFWCPWLIVFLLRSARWSERELNTMASAWMALIVVQLLPAFIKPLAQGDIAAYLVPLLPVELLGVRLPGHDAITAAADITNGTLRSAHHLGVVTVLGIIYLLALYWRNGRGRTVAAVFVLGAMLLMADAKHVVLSAVLVGMPAGALLLWPDLSRRARLRLASAGVVLVVGGAALAGAAVVQVVRAGLWEPLVGVASFNPKVLLVTRTAHLMDPAALHTWIGYGPGAYASRAASSRATGALFKDETQLPDFIPPHTPPAYESVVYDLYTADIATTTRFRSGMLTNPFSSLIGIIGEYGILGTIVFVVFAAALVRRGTATWRDGNRAASQRAFGATLAMAIPLLLVLSFFDTYFEQPDVVVPIALLWLLASCTPERA
ncbi:MAG TPA: hypothetical protein VFL88_05765 [Gemmatimonadales bacterium]|nr:hypothetical protein [Gemmatimonadales bacterium]